MFCGIFLLAATVALPVFAGITVEWVDTLSNVSMPTIPLSRPRCMVALQPEAPVDPLGKVKVLVAVGAGSDSFQVTASYQYYVTRGASVSFYCSGGWSNDALRQAALLESYLPQFTVRSSACAASGTLRGNSFDVLVVPGGYTALLTLRTSEEFRENILLPFLNELGGGNPSRLLLTFNEGSEVLIETGILYNVTTPLPGENISPLLASAFRDRNGTLKSLDFNTTTAIVALPSDAAHNKGINVTWGMTTNADADIVALLVSTSHILFAMAGDCPVTSNLSNETCENLDCMVPLTFPNNIFAPIDRETSIVSQLASFGPNVNLTTNTSRSNFNFSLVDACTNKQGRNTCAGQRVAVVVAHGTHDIQVTSLLSALEAVGSEPHLYCPDTDEGFDFFYAMPQPSVFPSAKISCTNYYNESYLSLEHVIFVLGGPIATHRRLMRDDNLLEVLDSAGSFALYGSGNVLMVPIKASLGYSNSFDTATAVLPSSLFVNTDLIVAGYQTADSTQAWANNITSTNSVALFRDEATRTKQKVFGGYSSTGDLLDAFDVFAATVFRARAWNEASQSNVDKVLGAVVISLVAVVVSVVVAVKCVRKRMKASRSSAYVAVRTTEETEIY